MRPAGQTHPVQIAGKAVGPRGFVAGLTTGFQLVGRPGADAGVLALAQQYENAQPWAHHWPD